MAVYRYNQNQSLTNFTGGQRDYANNVEYKRFSEEYFSGQDVRIYFGDIWVDEIVALQFSMQQNVAPIFGYASYTYDVVAKGARQIQGSFRINFKESYYLHFITNSLESKLEGSKELPGYDNLHQLNDLVTPDKLVEKFASGQQFEELASQYERALWSKADDGNFTKRTMNRGKGDFFTPTDGRPYLNKYGFNIVVLYGPYTQAQQSSAQGENVASTAHTLTGVHITGVNQVVDGSGQPIYEEYTFIARDLDSDVNTIDAPPRYGV
jgi:hypothetical protein